MLLPCVNHYQTAQNSKPQNPAVLERRWAPDEENIPGGCCHSWRSHRSVTTYPSDPEDHTSITVHGPRFFRMGLASAKKNCSPTSAMYVVPRIRCIRSKDEISGDIPPSSVAWYGFGKSCGSWVYVYADLCSNVNGLPLFNRVLKSEPKILAWHDHHFGPHNWPPLQRQVS